jgi:thiol:disulfide interchange protein
MLMFAYALGFSSLFLALGLGLARMPKSGSWLIYFQKASALLLIAASAYYFKCSIA